MANASFLSGYIQSNPQALYASIIGELPDPLKRYYSYKFNDIYSEYEGMLAKQAQNGVMPNLDFGQFLKSKNWLQEYQGLAPTQRGDYSSSILTRRTRRLNW